MTDEKKYNFRQYVYFERWTSYWYQLSGVFSLSPESVLVIGKGDGLVVDFLKKEGIEVKTLDNDAALSPDILASVEQMPLADNSFDCVLCAEVLEHLPFQKFDTCLWEIKRVVRKKVILSLPHFGPPFKLSFKIPFLREKKYAIKLPFPLKKRIGKEHHWEIGRKGFSASKIRRLIKNNFKIEREYVPFENQYHRFYLLEK